jgi:anti-sigma factor RsiW
MQVTREVLKDLIALYLAGEASPDTRALVEEALAKDPELAREVAASQADKAALPPTPELPPAAEKRTLDQTRRLLKNRTSSLVVAVLFTLLPLAFTFDQTGITFLLIRDRPIVGLAWWFTAAVMWIYHIIIRRRLRVLGL